MKIKFQLLASLLSILGVSSVNAAYIDVYQGGGYLGSIESYSGTETSADNYGLYSAQNHVINGPDITSQYGHVFFYDGADGLSFNTVFSSGGSFSSIANVKWDISLSGSTTNASVIVADDAQELFETSTNDVFKGNWRYNDGFGDGGVIGEIGGSDWELTIDPVSYLGGNYELYNLASYSNSGSIISLDVNTSESIVFKYASKIPEPSVIALLAIGLLGFSLQKRQKAL